MEPRHKSSVKYTQIPSELKTLIIGGLTELFADNLKSYTLVVEGRIYPQEILLRYGLKQPGRLRQNNFEVSGEFKEKEDSQACIDACLDAATSLVQEFFSTEATQDDVEVDWPFEWREYTFNGRKISMRYSTVNTDLEAEANRLLGITEDGLVKSSADELEDTKKRLH